MRRTIIAVDQPKRFRCAAEQTQDERLNQKLDQDGHARCAHRFTQPDLARAFRDRDQHDVHDADATHEQRDTGYETQNAVSVAVMAFKIPRNAA